MNNGEAPCYLRRIKEGMLEFRNRRPMAHRISRRVSASGHTGRQLGPSIAEGLPPRLDHVARSQDARLRRENNNGRKQKSRSAITKSYVRSDLTIQQSS